MISNDFIASCGIFLSVVVYYKYLKNDNHINTRVLPYLKLSKSKIENLSSKYKYSYFENLAKLYKEINNLFNQNNKKIDFDNLNNFIEITLKCLYDGQDIIYFFNIPTLWLQKDYSIKISNYQKRIVTQVRIILDLLTEYSKHKLDTTDSLNVLKRDFNRILLKISTLKEVIREYFLFQKTSNPIFNINSYDNIIYKVNCYFLQEKEEMISQNLNIFRNTTYIEEFQKNCSIKLVLMFNSLYEQLKLLNEPLVKKYITQITHIVTSTTENTIDENLITIDDNIDINNLVFSQIEITNLIEKPIPAIGVPVSNVVN